MAYFGRPGARTSIGGRRSVQQVQGIPRLDPFDPINMGLRLYYPMNGGALRGAILSDASGFGNDGTLVASPTLVSAQNGQAMSFNGSGSNAYINTGIRPVGVFSVTNRYAVSLWIRSATTQVQSFLSDAPSGTGSPASIDTFDNNGVWFGRMNIGGTDVTCTGGVVTPGVDYHVVLTYDGTNLSLYANGALIQSLAASGNVFNAASNLLIGRRGVDPTLYSYNGLISKVRLYNRQLTVPEIYRLYSDTTGNLGLITQARPTFFSFVGGGAYSFAWADIFASSDALTPLMLATASPSDSSVSSDATVGTGRATATPSDTGTSTDSQTGTAGATTSLSDTGVSFDNPIGSAMATALFNDNGVSLEGLVGTGTAATTLMDSAVSSDGVTGFMLMAALLNDTALSSDLLSIIASGAFFFNLSDIAASVDMTTAVARASAVINDTTTSGDTTQGSSLATAIITDTSVSGDISQSSASAAYSLMDTVASSDADQLPGSTAFILTDRATSTDSMSSVTNLVAAIMDAAATLDARVGNNGSAAGLSDVLSSSDSVAAVAASFIISLHDTATAHDMVSYLNLVRQLYPIVVPALIAPVERIGILSQTIRVAIV